MQHTVSATLPSTYQNLLKLVEIGQVLTQTKVPSFFETRCSLRYCLLPQFHFSSIILFCSSYLVFLHTNCDHFVHVCVVKVALACARM